MTVVQDAYNHDYDGALKAAGAEVHLYERFGSYQGDWYALVTHKGQTGWIHDYYGSCSGCDAFEGEFGYASEISAERLAEFGTGYLENILTTDQVLAQLEENSGWDTDAQEAIKWIQENAPKS